MLFSKPQVDEVVVGLVVCWTDQQATSTKRVVPACVCLRQLTASRPPCHPLDFLCATEPGTTGSSGRGRSKVGVIRCSSVVIANPLVLWRRSLIQIHGASEILTSDSGRPLLQNVNDGYDHKVSTVPT